MRRSGSEGQGQPPRANGHEKSDRFPPFLVLHIQSKYLESLYSLSAV